MQFDTDEKLAQKAQAKAIERTLLKELFLMALALLLILWLFYWLLGIAVSAFAPRMPVSFENSLGKVFSWYYESTEKSSDNPALQDLLDELSSKAPDTGFRYRVFVQDDGMGNAFALPGGIISFSSDLLEGLGEEERAFVLAHELGHFVHRDHIKSMGRGLLLFLLTAAIFESDSALNSMMVTVFGTAERRYSQEQELEADLFALRLLEKHYGRKGRGLGFLRSLCEDSSDSSYADLIYYFSTHPHPCERVKALEEHLEGSKGTT